MDISIIILSYNTRDLTLACLKSVCSRYLKEFEKKEFEMIVVDNNSSDDSVNKITELKSEFPNLSLIVSRENLGFAKGVNLAAKNAKGKYLFFLNSDTQINDNGLTKMVEYLENNSKIAILGGKLKNSDGSSQSSAGNFYNLANLILMLLGFERLGLLRSSPEKTRELDWVSGASMMIRKNVFEKLSGFDEGYFMYLEDMDICFRARKIGYETHFFSDINLMHKSLGSSNRTFAIINIYKGILHFYSKNKSSFEYLIVKILLTLKAQILILLGYLTFNSELKERYRKAISII